MLQGGMTTQPQVTNPMDGMTFQPQGTNSVVGNLTSTYQTNFSNQVKKLISGVLTKFFDLVDHINFIIFFTVFWPV